MRNAWPVLALLASALCLLLGSLYVGFLAAKIEEAAGSIVRSGAPDVLYLLTLPDDIRHIERLVLHTTPASIAVDRAAITALTDDIDRAEVAHLTTPDYPGELEAYQALVDKRRQFVAAVEGLLDDVAAGRQAGEGRARVRSSADEMALSVSRLVDLNAREVMVAAQVIGGLRRRLLVLSVARDGLALCFVLAGTLLGIEASRRQRALAEERRRLDEERLAELDAFAGRVAHDLRDVLGVVLMRAAMGKGTHRLEDATEALTQVTRQSQRMGALIDALLSFARSGAHPEPGACTAIAGVIQEVVADVQPSATEAGIEIVVDPISAEGVACDAAVLSVVLSNLVRNAVKYMGRGHDARRARRVTLRTREEGPLVRVDVEDTGPGLPPGGEARVFQPFVRLGSSQDRPEGLGLGLATVKRLVEANGGRVGVESRGAAGCLFWFTLPRSAWM